MAKRVFSTSNVTFVAQAAGSIITNASSYMGLRSTLAGQLVDILEILISGMGSASTIAAMQYGRQSTNSATETALAAPNSDGGEFPGITALATIITTYITATTQPIPSNAAGDAKLIMGLNTFGGILRWNAAPTQQFQHVGSTAPGAAGILMNNSATTGAANALANAHIIYEPY